MENRLKYDAIVIGVSAGGLHALSQIFRKLPASYPIPVIVVQHRSKDERTLLEEVLQEKVKLKIRQADEKEKIEGKCIYFAPPDYHLLIERNRTFSLSYDAPVNYSRPSIDVLFETAASVYKHALLGIILTGANSDGANGITAIRRYGGTTIAQNPATAQFNAMPGAAVETGSIQKIFDLEQIEDFLITLAEKKITNA